MTLDDVINELHRKNFENKHFLPQSFFLGSDLSYFTNVYKIRDLKLFEDQINNFFNAKLTIPHLQNKKMKQIQLSKKQLEKLHGIYCDDFILLKKISN